MGNIPEGCIPLETTTRAMHPFPHVSHSEGYYPEARTDLICDVSTCDNQANIIHNGVKLCRRHHDDPEWDA